MQGALLPHSAACSAAATASNGNCGWRRGEGAAGTHDLAIERDIAAHSGADSLPLRVYPALQALPPIAFGATGKVAGPDEAQRAQLAAQAWALQRWRAGAVDATPRHPQRRTSRGVGSGVAGRPAAQGLAPGRIERVREGPPRLQLALASP